MSESIPAQSAASPGPRQTAAPETRCPKSPPLRQDDVVPAYFRREAPTRAEVREMDPLEQMFAYHQAA